MWWTRRPPCSVSWLSAAHDDDANGCTLCLLHAAGIAKRLLGRSTSEPARPPPSEPWLAAAEALMT